MKTTAALILTTALYSGMSSACTKPTAPALPDASSAVTAQMIKAKGEVKAFLAAAQEYLDCTKSSAAHNAMVDEMQSTANAFNEIVRAYKARMANA